MLNKQTLSYNNINAEGYGKVTNALGMDSFKKISDSTNYQQTLYYKGNNLNTGFYIENKQGSLSLYLYNNGTKSGGILIGTVNTFRTITVPGTHGTLCIFTDSDGGFIAIAGYSEADVEDYASSEQQYIYVLLTDTAFYTASSRSDINSTDSNFSGKEMYTKQLDFVIMIPCVELNEKAIAKGLNLAICAQEVANIYKTVEIDGAKYNMWGIGASYPKLMLQVD
jgi:hypothetical protein